jgi:transposase
MESNKLYEVLLNLPFIMVRNVKIDTKELHINCESQLESGHCPNCLEQCYEVNQSQERILQDLSISDHKVYLHLKSRQFICKKYNRFFYEGFHFASKYERITMPEDFIYRRCSGFKLC